MFEQKAFLSRLFLPFNILTVVFLQTRVLRGRVAGGRRRGGSDELEVHHDSGLLAAAGAASLNSQDFSVLG